VPGGSRTRRHEGAGFGLFNEHSGTEVYQSTRLFKSLGAALLGMDMAVYAHNLDDQARGRAWIDRVTGAAYRTAS
jgi:hypothetical protein